MSHEILARDIFILIVSRQKTKQQREGEPGFYLLFAIKAEKAHDSKLYSYSIPISSPRKC